MWNFSLFKALGVIRRTFPYIALRMLVYFGIALLYILAAGGGGAIGYGFTSFGDGQGTGSIYGALFGLAGASGFLYFAREYILYLVKAGHIAVLTCLYDGKKLAEGRDQVDYGISVVQDNFREASVLFGLDQLIKGVLKIVTCSLLPTGAIVPVKGSQTLTAIIRKILAMSLTYVNEIIIAHHFRSGSSNPWHSSKNALVLYAQNYRTIAKNAVWLWLFIWLQTFAIFLVLLAPALAITSAMPGDIGSWSFVLAFLLAWSVKAAVLEPMAIYALLQVFFKTIEGQRPDPVWEDRLNKTSRKFRELKDKAALFVSSPAARGMNDADMHLAQLT